MARFEDRKQRKAWKKIRIRKRLHGTAKRPRICVFKSHKYIYAQAVDDLGGVTMASASSQEPSLRGAFTTSGKHASAALKVGSLLSSRLREKGIDDFVFDRSGYLFHGKIKAVCDGLNEGFPHKKAAAPTEG